MVKKQGVSATALAFWLKQLLAQCVERGIIKPVDAEPLIAP